MTTPSELCLSPEQQLVLLQDLFPTIPSNNLERTLVSNGNNLGTTVSELSCNENLDAVLEHLNSDVDMLTTPRVSMKRTSLDVYNRIKHDYNYDAQHFLVGVLDRFHGYIEKPLESISRDVTNDDFVPFHRIFYFRRQSDNKIVWDRRTGVDLIFSIN